MRLKKMLAGLLHKASRDANNCLPIGAVSRPAGLQICWRLDMPVWKVAVFGAELVLCAIRADGIVPMAQLANGRKQ
jgi:hypothetical protein